MKNKVLEKTLTQLIVTIALIAIAMLLYYIVPIAYFFLIDIYYTKKLFFIGGACIFLFIVLYIRNFFIVEIENTRSVWIMRTTNKRPICEFINVEVRGENGKFKTYFNRKTIDIDFTDDAIEPVISYLPKEHR